MIDKIQNLASSFFIKQNKIKELTVKTFSFVVKKAKKIFLIMPDNEDDYKSSISIIVFLLSENKELVLLTNSINHYLLPNFNSKIKIEEYFEADKNKINFPKKIFREKLKFYDVDLVLDLNKSENIFASICSKIIKAGFVIGFNKKNSDKYYDIQFSSKENDSEISYKNLLNCLQMF